MKLWLLVTEEIMNKNGNENISTRKKKKKHKIKHTNMPQETVIDLDTLKNQAFGMF